MTEEQDHEPEVDRGAGGDHLVNERRDLFHRRVSVGAALPGPPTAKPASRASRSRLHTGGNPDHSVRAGLPETLCLTPWKKP